MKANDSRKLSGAVWVAAVSLVPFLGWGQSPFPEGPARDTVVLVCSQCHPLTRIIDNELSAEQWEFVLYDMIARGAPVHEESLELVRQYLIDNFAMDER